MVVAFRSSLSRVLTLHFPLFFLFPSSHFHFSNTLNSCSSTHATFSLSSTAELCCRHCCLLASPLLSSKTDLVVPYLLHSRTRFLNLSFAIAVAACSPPLHRYQKSVLQCLILFSRSKPAADSSSLYLSRAVKSPFSSSSLCHSFSLDSIFIRLLKKSIIKICEIANYE
ncbi:uncharacterized protein DS421_1g32180 [Arachis hypogaea]|nr:uncharacterized protein DS421_1g32180 [Arachis hypogaea]